MELKPHSSHYVWLDASKYTVALVTERVGDVDEEEWKKDVAEHQRKKAKMNPQSEEEKNRRQEPQYRQEVQDVPGSGSETNRLNIAPPPPQRRHNPPKPQGKIEFF